MAFQQNKPVFGATGTTANASTGFGGFGTTATTSGGFAGFGSTGTAPALGFGATTTTSAPSFGFGGLAAPGASSTSTGFGTATTTNTAGTGLFSFGTGSGFGAATTTTTSSTGTFSFGTGTAGSGLGAGGTGFATGLGGASSTGFGAGLAGGLTGGLAANQASQQQQQQQQQQSQDAYLSNMAQAVSLPLIMADERDAVLAKWNQLQAYWGTGKGYFNRHANFVNFKPDNPFCRFKAVGYTCLPTAQDSDGLVGITFNKPDEELRANQQQLVDNLHRLLGGKPQHAVCVEGVKSLPDNKCEMIIYIQERSQTGTTKRIRSSEVLTFLTQANMRTPLQQLSVIDILPKSGFDADQLKFYLDNPPTGIDPLIWQQAKLDNPDPSKLLPVPMIGFKELHNRLVHQEHQTSLYGKRLDVITQDIAALQRDHSNMVSKVEQYKRKQLQLSHRVLQVMVKQEIYRKLGYAIQTDEEQLKVQLEALQAELNAPTQFKGRLNELMSQLRMQNQLGAVRPEATYQMDEAVQQEIRQHLKQQQEGIQHLISIIKDDVDDLQLIEQGLADSTLPRR